jgi:hypothetical protein
MPSGTFAAYYPFDTLDVVPKLSHAEKLEQFETRLRQAYVNMGWAAGNMRLTNWVGFFAVPEYYFLKRYETVGRELRIELYDVSELNNVIGRMIGLSDQFNRIVILPGTISWRRPIGATIKGTKQGKPADIKYDGFSTAPAFFAGNQLASYDKKMNDASIDNYVAETRFVSGTSSSLFDVGTFRCGIEICGDFNEGNLAKATGPQSLDFEFMMSGTNYHMFIREDMDKIPVRNGGYFLHVDQAPKKAAFYNGVWCVSRGSGWHGVSTDGIAGAVVDPWSTRTIQQDRYGVESSVGHVVALVNVPGQNTASGRSLPGAKSFAGLRLLANTAVTGALDSSGQYEVTLKVELSRVSGSTSDIAGRTIHFKAKRAQLLRDSGKTDGTGKAQAVFRCNREQPGTLIAEFHAARAEVEAKIAWLGPGEVTKISGLKGTPHSEVPTFFTPL